MVKRLSTTWETRVRSLGWEDPLEKEMAIHSRTGKSDGQRSLVGYSPWGPKELDTTERLSSSNSRATDTFSFYRQTNGGPKSLGDFFTGLYQVREEPKVGA